jgi:hypothetical protein
MESVAEHQEGPKEGAVVEPFKGRKKQHRGQKLAAGRRGDPKELTREICGSRKELATAGRKMTRRAGVAQREGNFIREYSTKDNVAPRTGKDGRRIRPRINLLEVPRKDGHSEAGTEISRSSYILGAKGNHRNQQEDNRAGNRETTSKDFRLVAANQELESMEGSTPL